MDLAWISGEKAAIISHAFALNEMFIVPSYTKLHPSKPSDSNGCGSLYFCIGNYKRVWSGGASKKQSYIDRIQAYAHLKMHGLFLCVATQVWTKLEPDKLVMQIVFNSSKGVDNEIIEKSATHHKGDRAIRQGPNRQNGLVTIIVFNLSKLSCHKSDPDK